jgi:hypothetical protein
MRILLKRLMVGLADRPPNLALLLLVTRQPGWVRNQTRGEDINSNFDGGCNVGSKEIIDQPTVRGEERHSGYA